MRPHARALNPGRRSPALWIAVSFFFLAPASGAGQAATAASPARVASERMVEGPTAQETLVARRTLHEWLLSEMPAGTAGHVISIQLSLQERLDLEREEATRGAPLRVGMTRPVSLRIDLSSLASRPLPAMARPLGHGLLRATPDGGFVWAVTVGSEKASGLRLHITDLDLPPDADLFFFNLDGEAFGPYSRRGPNDTGDFWTHTVSGSTGVLLLRHYGPVGAGDPGRASFSIAEIGHLGPRFPMAAPESFCSRVAPCVENAMCHNGTPADDARLAAAMMQWVSGNFIYSCTGGLIGDTDPGSQIPYFLTANHCLSKNRDAQSLETFFQFQAACGVTSCPASPGGIRTLGATVKATGHSGDFTLLQLSQSPPAGSVLLGWNNQPIAFSEGADIYRISHPNGAPQAFSQHRVDASVLTCGGWPRGARIYSRDIIGATQAGSSGAPVVNGAGEIVGQLSGTCGSNVNDDCDAVSNATVDGALASYYDQVAPFLNPPVPGEICNDAIDNDGDTLIDCADPDCAADPACTPCKPAGASCASNSECCSSSCKGPASSRTCR